MIIMPKLTALFQRSDCSESMEHLELNLGHETLSALTEARNLFRQVPRLTVLKLSGRRVKSDVLLEVPLSVRELSVNISTDRIDESRKAFVGYLNSRYTSGSSTVPVKARFHLVDTVDTFPAQKRLDSLKKSVGSSLDAVME